MLETTCVFRRNTVNRLYALQKSADPAQLLLKFVSDNEPLFKKRLPTIHENSLFKQHFKERVARLWKWIRQCQQRVNIYWFLCLLVSKPSTSKDDKTVHIIFQNISRIKSNIELSIPFSISSHRFTAMLNNAIPAEEKPSVKSALQYDESFSVRSIHYLFISPNRL